MMAVVTDIELVPFAVPPAREDSYEVSFVED